MAQTNLVGQTILGYTVTEKINSGAYGTVYKVVKNNASGQYVRALKHITIPTEKQYYSLLNSMGGDVSKADNYISEMLKGIVSEIGILNYLSEKGVQHIVRYYENDISMTQNPLRYDIYILMEYLTPLDDYVSTHPFTVGDVMNLAFDVLEGLQACHINGVIHRDVKNENIFVSNDGQYKIGDFGVSKILKDSSRAESLKGTPNYLAPEVYLGKEGYTSSVDLYSLGIVLYRLLNYDRNPFVPKFPEMYYPSDEDNAFEQRMTGKTPDAPLLGGERIAAVIVKAISNSRERYRTAEEFLEDLRNAVRDTDEEIQRENVKMETTAETETAFAYSETIGESAQLFTPPNNKTMEDQSGSINKHLFDTVGEERIDSRPELTENQKAPSQNGVEKDRTDTGKNKNRASSGRRVVERVPMIEDSQPPEAIDRKVIGKAVFAAPIAVLLVGVIACYIILPQMFGQTISIVNWLASDSENIIKAFQDPSEVAAYGIARARYIVIIKTVWYVWLASFITSLFFVGKQLQRKPEPKAVNAILVKKEPYILAQDIMSALKEESLSNQTKEFKMLANSFQVLVEKLSVESDFGIGREAVIQCENNIARQLQYLLDAVPCVSSGNVQDNICELNKAIANVDFLLRKRTELKKK